MEALATWCSTIAARPGAELCWDVQRDVLQASWFPDRCPLMAWQQQIVAQSPHQPHPDSLLTGACKLPADRVNACGDAAFRSCPCLPCRLCHSALLQCLLQALASLCIKAANQGSLVCTAPISKAMV